MQFTTIATILGLVAATIAAPGGKPPFDGSASEGNTQCASQDTSYCCIDASQVSGLSGDDIPHICAHADVLGNKCGQIAVCCTDKSVCTTTQGTTVVVKDITVVVEHILKKVEDIKKKERDIKEIDGNVMEGRQIVPSLGTLLTGIINALVANVLGAPVAVTVPEAPKAPVAVAVTVPEATKAPDVAVTAPEAPVAGAPVAVTVPEAPEAPVAAQRRQVVPSLGTLLTGIINALVANVIGAPVAVTVPPVLPV